MTIEEARQLRRDGLSVAQIQARLGVSKRALATWLAGIPAPVWTARPNAKDDLRARAVELRAEHWSVNDIALELGVAKSTAWLWVKHLPLDPDSERAQRKQQHARDMNEARWADHNTARELAHAGAVAEAADTVGCLSDREMLLLGAAIYWCEGSKSKPWRRDERLAFINSDPVLIAMFLRFLAVLDVPTTALRMRVSIHESADAGAATAWWAQRIGIPAESFQRPTIKNIGPRRSGTIRDPTITAALIIYVRRSRELYWRVEGVMEGLAHALDANTFS